MKKIVVYIFLLTIATATLPADKQQASKKRIDPWTMMAGQNINWRDHAEPEVILSFDLATGPEYNQDMIIELLENNPKVLQNSLSNRVLPDNVLMRAIQTGAVKLVEYILNQDPVPVDVNMTIAKTTPLALAVSSYIKPHPQQYRKRGYNPQSYINITNLLVDKGAMVTQETIELARKNEMPQEMIEFLEKNKQ